jgi:energy-coupling factor transporter ATP-binding protein EcfA2
VARVFVSYATPDRAIADEVSNWLRTAGHETFLDGDLRDGISVGEDWKQRLYRELRKVDAVIGVVTSSFLASNWCSAELGIADALGCRLMPVRAETGVVHPLMRDLQYADYQADPQQARDRLLRAVRLLEDGGGTWREGENPFPGLEPFTAALSRVFSGRAAEAREVANRLRVTGGTAGMLAIVGPSGCGKSSLLNAAVAPLLDSDPAWLTVPPLVPGNDPVAELAGALTSTATRLGLDWLARDVRDRLEAGIDGLRRVAGDLLAAWPGTHQRRLLVPIDQAEELFTRTTPTALQGFAQLLHEAVRGPVQENGLSAQLVSDTGSGDALPLLAFTLRQLADGLPAGGTLTLARYRSLGGVRGALTRHADAALAEAVRTSGLTEREVLAGLTRLVTIDETGRRARRRIKIIGLSESLRVALHVFVDRRLLLSDTDDDGQVWLTVAHEALLTGWRPLDAATADITRALRIARTVEQAAADWNSAGRPAHYRWDAERLTATRTTLGIPGGSGNPTAPPMVDFDDEALAFLDATARRVHAARERERRRRTRTITVLSILLVLALIAAGLAAWQQQAARGAQRTAIAQAMVARADQIRDHDPRAALQFGVAARHFDTSPQTHAGLRQTLAANSHFTTFHDREVSGVAFAPDGRTLATTSADQTIKLWDVGNRDRPRQLGQPLRGHDTGVKRAAFAPDGRTLATAGDDGDVILWDVSDRERPQQLGQPLTGHDSAVLTVALSSDGRTLATGSSDKTARLWDLPPLDRFAGDEVREACLRAGGPLDKATWEQYASGVNYQDTCADR